MFLYRINLSRVLVQFVLMLLAAYSNGYNEHHARHETHPQCEHACWQCLYEEPNDAALPGALVYLPPREEIYTKPPISPIQSFRYQHIECVVVFYFNHFSLRAPPLRTV